MAGYPTCVSDECMQGRAPCPTPAQYAKLTRRSLDRHLEAKFETRNLFQLLLAKGSITVAHRQPASIWRRLWLALT